jgi:transposase
MSQINSIRDQYRSGASISSIARQETVCRATVRKYAYQDNFSPELPEQVTRPSILDPFKEIIISWLKDDEKRWHKQRHTAVRIHKRLQEEHGFTGSYPTVQRFVSAWKASRGQEEVYAELVWHPAQAQADFGQADFYENGVKVRRYYLVLSFPYSNHAYYQVFRGETSECVCQGLKSIFEHMGGVPAVIVFDNAAGVGRRICNKLIETELFSKFRQHYNFAARLCNSYAGHEKGHVENKVGTIRRQCFVPEPHITDINTYNRELLFEAEKQFQKTHYKKGVLTGQLFQEDHKAMLPLNRHDFDVVTYKTCQADKTGKVWADPNHRYASLPEMGGKTLLIGLRAEYVDILTQSHELIVRHRREFGKKRTDSEHPWGMLQYASRHPRSWFNIPLRDVVDEDLRQIIDAQTPSDRRGTLKLLDRLSKQSSVAVATQSILTAASLDLEHIDDIAALAARIQDGGIDMPLLPGPDLQVYDRFLQRGQEAQL